jgi:type IV pilus assembly protein PilE
MDKGTKYRRKGFTLLELMIVILIVAIITGLAYPSFVEYVRKSKRGDAQQLLMNWSINQEIWRSNHPTYDDGTGLAVPTGENYSFSVTGASGNAYLLTAAAKTGSDQINDTAKDGTACSSMTLDQDGQKLPAGCWE